MRTSFIFAYDATVVIQHSFDILTLEKALPFQMSDSCREKPVSTKISLRSYQEYQKSATKTP